MRGLCVSAMVRSFTIPVVLLLLACPAKANEPPTAQQLEQYRNDGTLSERIALARRIGNHRSDPISAARMRYRAQLEVLKARGVLEQDAIAMLEPPPAWQGGLPSTGSPKILVLLVDFPDFPHYPNQTAADVQSKFFGNGNDAQHPYESLRNYYQRSSYSQLTIQGTVLGWYTATHNRNHYGDLGYSAGNEELFMEVLNHYDAVGHDFTQYDNDGDGVLDGIFLKWTGPDTGWSNFWWGYMGYWGENPSYRIDGKSLDRFVWSWISEGEGDVWSGDFDPLVDIHETGHLLGLPDYYDYDGNIGPDGGVGGLDMMHANIGDHNCFSKFLLEWLTPSVVACGAEFRNLLPSGTSTDCVLAMPGASAGDAFDEFFMMQYRKQGTGNDPTDYPASGMIVWHVDSTLDEEGNDFLYNNQDTQHKLLRLMEADGLEEIERDLPADAGDFYVPPSSFGPNTTPNSNDYAGQATGVYLERLTAPGNSMSGHFGSGMGCNVAITLWLQNTLYGNPSEYLFTAHLEDENGPMVGEDVTMTTSKGYFVESGTNILHTDCGVSGSANGHIRTTEFGPVTVCCSQDHAPYASQCKDDNFAVYPPPALPAPFDTLAVAPGNGSNDYDRSCGLAWRPNGAEIAIGAARSVTVYRYPEKTVKCNYNLEPQSYADATDVAYEPAAGGMIAVTDDSSYQHIFNSENGSFISICQDGSGTMSYSVDWIGSQSLLTARMDGVSCQLHKIARTTCGQQTCFQNFPPSGTHFDVTRGRYHSNTQKIAAVSSEAWDADAGGSLGIFNSGGTRTLYYANQVGAGGFYDCDWLPAGDKVVAGGDYFAAIYGANSSSVTPLQPINEECTAVAAMGNDRVAVGDRALLKIFSTSGTLLGSMNLGPWVTDIAWNSQRNVLAVSNEIRTYMFNFSSDQAPPSIFVPQRYDVPFGTTTVQIQGTVTDQTNDYLVLEVRVDAGVWTPVTIQSGGVFSISINLPDEETVVALRATDYYRQRSSAQTVIYVTPEPPIEPPTLLLPFNGAVCQPTTGLLDWSDVDGATGYKLQIGSSCGAGSEYSVTSSSYSYSLAAGGSYFWRVASGDSNGNYGSFSDCFSFSTDPGQLQAPALQAPANGATCVPVAVVLDWAEVLGATSYLVQCGTDCGSGSETEVSQSQLELAGVPSTIYYWRVRTKNSCGVLGPYSDCGSFTTGPNPLDPPLLASPEDGAIEDGSPVLLRWSEVVGASGYGVQVGSVCGTGAEVEVSGLEYAFQGLPGMSYYWRVRTKDVCGNFGEYSSCFMFSIEGGVPTGQWALYDDGISSGAPYRSYCQGVYDAVRDRLTFFGGGPNYQGDVWAFGFTDRTWQQLHDGSGTAPPATFACAQIYDPARDAMLIYGGATGDAPLSKTWRYTYATNTWVELTTQNADGRSFGACVYDPLGHRMIVYGGGGSGDWHEDVRALPMDGSGPYAWQVLNAGGVGTPGDRLDMTGEYDPVTNRVLVFGGVSPSSQALGDLWAFSLTTNTWTLLSAGGPGAPSARRRYVAAVDPVQRKYYLFSGWDGGTQILGDTWAWDLDLGGWTEVDDGTGPSSPAERLGAISIFRPVQGGQFVVFGGANQNGYLRETWSLAGAIGEATLLLPPDGATCQGLTGTLDWADVPGAASYRVRIGTGCETGAEQDVATSQCSYSLNAGTTYYWQVAAINGAGQLGSYSGCFSFSTRPDPLAPPALIEPSNGATCVATETTLNWSDVSGAIGYKVQVGTGCGSGPEAEVSPSQYAFAGQPLTTYYWRVASRNSCGEYGAYSACYSFTTKPVGLPAPTLLNPPNGATDQPATVTLDWSDVVGAAAYVVQVGLTCEVGAETESANSQLEFTGTPGATYYWRVKTKDNCGTLGSYSDCFSFTTGSVPSSVQWAMRDDGVASGATNRMYSQGVYDPVRDRLAFFGGANPGYARDVRAYDFGLHNWSTLHDGSGTAPTQRMGAAEIYDPERDAIVMYGGASPSDPYQDTWRFSFATNTWTQLNTTNGDGRSFFGAIYDPVDHRMVVYAGGGSSVWRSDVRALPLEGDGPYAWVVLNAGGGGTPGARLDMTIAYDPMTRRILVFGGVDQSNITHGDIWAFSLVDNSWTLLSSGGPGSPAARRRYVAAIDPVQRKYYIFGGWDGASQILGDTWAWDLDLGGWTLLDDGTSEHSPIRRAGAISTLRTAGGSQFVVFGGGNQDGYVRDLWMLTNPTSDTEEEVTLPASYSSRCFPNPSLAGVQIELQIPEQGWTSVVIYSIDGLVVRRLFEGESEPGTKYLTWDGNRDDGSMVASGVYFVRSQHLGSREVGRIVLVR